MRFDNYLEAHVQSGDRSSLWYFRVPDGWTGQAPGVLANHVLATMDAIYRDTNARLQAAEPSDINYLAPLRVSCIVLTPEQEAEKPWLKASSPAIWEWTPCVVVEGDGGDGSSYEKVELVKF
jgi:hypothetical protein